MKIMKNSLTDTRAIGARMVERMRELDISKVELANTARISYRAIHYIASGESRPVRAETVRNIAGALGLRYEWLADGQPPKLANVVREPETAGLYQVAGSARPPAAEPKLTAGWEARLHRVLCEKSAMIVAARNEYELPIEDALRPAVKAFIEGERK